MTFLLNIVFKDAKEHWPGAYLWETRLFIFCFSTHRYFLNTLFPKQPFIYETHPYPVSSIPSQFIQQTGKALSGETFIDYQEILLFFRFFLPFSEILQVGRHVCSCLNHVAFLLIRMLIFSSQLLKMNILINIRYLGNGVESSMNVELWFSRALLVTKSFSEVQSFSFFHTHTHRLTSLCPPAYTVHI